MDADLLKRVKQELRALGLNQKDFMAFLLHHPPLRSAMLSLVDSPNFAYFSQIYHRSMKMTIYEPLINLSPREIDKTEIEKLLFFARAILQNMISLNHVDLCFRDELRWLDRTHSTGYVDWHREYHDQALEFGRLCNVRRLEGILESGRYSHVVVLFEPTMFPIYSPVIRRLNA